MRIDWFTVVAQALNFVLLVWLMKRFLYTPILEAVAAREKLISTELADAAKSKAEASDERKAFQQKSTELDAARAAILKEATDQANAERQKLLEQARKAADVLSADRKTALHNETKTLHQAIARSAREEVFAIARRALTDLASSSLEERLADVFTRQLRALDADSKAAFATALATVTASEPAVVRSTFELPEAQRAALRQALNETFSADVAVRFDTAPELVCGIELRARGQKLAWSIQEYLGSLARRVDELVPAPVAAEPAAQTKPKDPTPLAAEKRVA